MSKLVKLFPYKAGSAAAKVLAGELGILRLRHKGSRFKGSARKTVINYGSVALTAEAAKCNVINDPDKVSRASNKLKFFRFLKANGVEEHAVPFTESKEQVRKWIEEGHTVVARTLLTANSGRGIVLLDKDSEEIVDAKLYTLYVPKKREYRVHLGRNKDGKIVEIDSQIKARNKDVADDDVNWKIRNHGNGFIFARNLDEEIPHDVYERCNKVFSTLGLDFAAIDVIYNKKEGKAYVIEVNTAPGLEGTTLDNYVKFFKEKLGL